ncbi:MAG: hypothetical protein ABJG42_24675 [Vibrio splendidus]
MNIEQALNDASRPGTYRELSELTGIGISKLNTIIPYRQELYMLMMSNKADNRQAQLESEIKAIEAKAQELGVTPPQASVLMGRHADYYSRCVRKLGGNYEKAYTPSKKQEYIDAVIAALKDGANSVTEAAKISGIPIGSVNAAVNGNGEVKRLADANKAAASLERYREGYDRVKVLIDKGETARDALRILGLDYNYYYRARKALGIEVSVVGRPSKKTGYNRLLTMPLTGKSSLGENSW